MLTNNKFLKVIKESFKAYLSVGTSRSTTKLKTLHGHIAKDLKEKLGREYSIQSLGYGNGKEGCIDGRYYPKNVDITIYYKDKAIAGYALKFVMRNYSQNSNNYFENMLGETANLRSNAIPYFQIFIIFDKVPYYKKNGSFQKYDVITQQKLDKYLKLSNDDPNVYFHTPNKTLVILLSLKEKKPNYQFLNQNDYAKYYKSMINYPGLITYSNKIDDLFGGSIILNDYNDFIVRTTALIIGSQKN